MADQEYVFVWNIHNFSSNFHKTGHGIISPVFTVDSLKKSQWFLDMYPQGSTEEYKDYISIFLIKNRNDTSPEEFKLRFQFDMIGGDGNTLQKDETDKTNNIIFSDAETNCWGIPNFAAIKNVTSKMEDWPEDVLTLRCRMFFNSEQSTSECEGRTEIGVDQLSFVWNVRIRDISTQVLRRELFVSKDSEFEILLNMPGDDLKIDIHSDKQLTKPKSVSCKMALVDSKGKVLISKSAHHLFEANVKNVTWEFPAIITKKFLDDTKAAFVLNDTICLLCKWISSKGILTNTILSSNNDSNSCSILQKQFQNMLLDGTYSDIKLKVGNEVIQAHKCVLAARSPVFSAMFQQDMLESKTNIVEIDDVEAGVLKSFLKFVYTERLEHLDYETAMKLLMVAEKYEVLTLKEKCVVFLESVLTLGNVFEILDIADLIDHERLKSIAVNIVASNSEVILDLPEWSILIKNNANLATEIISKIVSSKKQLN